MAIPGVRTAGDGRLRPGHRANEGGAREASHRSLGGGVGLRRHRRQGPLGGPQVAGSTAKKEGTCITLGSPLRLRPPMGRLMLSEAGHLQSSKTTRDSSGASSSAAPQAGRGAAKGAWVAARRRCRRGAPEPPGRRSTPWSATFAFPTRTQGKRCFAPAAAAPARRRPLCSSPRHGDIEQAVRLHARGRSADYLTNPSPLTCSWIASARSCARRKEKRQATGALKDISRKRCGVSRTPSSRMPHAIFRC